MKIKDLIKFHAFRGAEFIDFITQDIVIDEEKEIEDIHEIQLAEKIEQYGEYRALHRWIIVYLILKEEK